MKNAMKTSIQEQLENHRSVRKYKSKKVSTEIIKSIIESGSKASSSGNMQAYSVIVTEDEKLKKKMYPFHFKQEMALKAPVIITFCSDFYRMKRWLKISNAPDNFDNLMSFMIGAIDAILASQNAALAAESHGLGMCYMGTTLASCTEIATILDCPSNVVPVVGFAMGYPDEKPKEKKRLPVDCIIHKDKYHLYSDEDIKLAYSEKEFTGWDRYTKCPNLKSKIKKLSVKNLAQIYTKIKYTEESHIKYSNNILRCLIEKNFI